MTNKKIGNNFEEQFCQILSDNGFWVHRLKQDQSGQPADVISAKNGKVCLIDCKVCSKSGFALSRIEENQDLSMSLWKECGNGEPWFALRIDSEIFMVSYTDMTELRKCLTVIAESVIHKHGITLLDWISKHDILGGIRK